jgi:hypothetical protein
MEENEMLRERVGRLEQGRPAEEPPALAAASASAGELASLKAKVRELSGKLKSSARDRERLEADKLTVFTEMQEAVHKLEAELKREKARALKAERMHTSACSDLALAQAQLFRNQPAPQA